MRFISFFATIGYRFWRYQLIAVNAAGACCPVNGVTGNTKRKYSFFLVMQPVLLYYANLLLCSIAFFELLFARRKSATLKVYFLLIAASLFVMNFYAITGFGSRIDFIFARFMRLIYTCCTLLALVKLVQPRAPHWLVGLMVFAAISVTGLRIVYYHEINLQALVDLPNPMFSIGAEFYTPKPIARTMMFALTLTSVVVGYYYYRQLLMKLDYSLPQHKQISRWVIALVLPLFMLTIFGMLGNMKVVNPVLATYLFAIFSFSSICSLILRPRFIDAGGIEVVAGKAVMG